MNTISIIISAHNAGPYIAETLESVLVQTHRDFELLVYDDGSSDNTWAVIESFAARDARMSAVRQENKGQSATLNRGLDEARAPLAMIFDADDRMMPNCVAEQVAFMQAHPDLVGAGCLARFINARGQAFWIEKNPFCSYAAFERAFSAGETLFYRHPGFILRRDAFQKLPYGYRDGIPQANDIDLFNRLADLGAILTNPQALMEYRVHSNQISMQYSDRLAPRLTWAWIAACNRVRRSGQPEPAFEAFRVEFGQRPWAERLSFVLKGLSVSCWYEAKADFINARWQFAWKAALALVLKAGAWLFPAHNN